MKVSETRKHFFPFQLCASLSIAFYPSLPMPVRHLCITTFLYVIYLLISITMVGNRNGSRKFEIYRYQFCISGHGLSGAFGPESVA